MSSCAHMQFMADVRVGRLTEADEGTVKGFTADVRIRCVDCGTPFTFRGLPMGSSPDRPTVSADGEEARMPIQPGDASMLAIACAAGRA